MMQNNFFKIEFKPETGTVKSLVMNHDPDGMNWVEGLFSWGLPADFEFVEMKSAGNEVHSRYRKETLELEVIRTLEPDRLNERYIYRNTGYYDLYFQRGGLGIYATFNDSYPESDICIKKRCHAHIWCGGEHSYIHARKMGPFPTELALILTHGSLDSYSVERIE